MIVDIQRKQRDVPRNGHDKPMVVPPGGGRPVALSRVTTFIDCIEDKSNLAMWGKRKVLIGCAMDPSLTKGVLELDDTIKDDRDTLNRRAEVAMDVAGANEKRDKGSHLHKLSEHVDRHEVLPDGLSKCDLLDMAAYALATAEMQFRHIEEFTTCLELLVGGTPDRICWYSGPGPDGKHIEGWFIFDLKTGTVEYGGLKMATQLAIYSRSAFYDWAKFPAPPYAKKVTKKEDPEGFEAWKRWDEWCKTEFDAAEAAAAYSPIPEVSQDLGIILNLPAGSSEAELYWADLRVGWEAANLATTIRKFRSLSSKALTPFAGHVVGVGV